MDKNLKRQLKLAAATSVEARQALRQYMNAERKQTESTMGLLEIDCACVIHGSGYEWTYVDRLYNMLTRHLTPGVKLHVYTEADRHVPEPYIKHSLTDWQISGPKQSWWYKIQLFNTEHHAGKLLYFDLDTVITSNIDWIWKLDSQHLWSVRDFKYLWRPTSYNINSSVMWWDTTLFDHVYKNFARTDLNKILKKYRGDQDYISDCVAHEQRRFFENDRVVSWRWQAFDGGFDFVKRIYKQPGAGALILQRNSIIVFHGQPKPMGVQDPVIVQNWI